MPSDLDQVDHGSFAFRYHGKKFGETERGAEEVWIDFNAILDQSQHVYNVLNSIQVYLIETYGRNAELEGILNSL